MAAYAPTAADLGIEIGKAQAMAEAAQASSERMESNLSDRMDRIEKSMADGFKRVEELLSGVHQDITNMKVEDGRRDGKEEANKHTHSTALSIIAIIVALISGFAGAIHSFFTGHQ